jgi:hypothetical protein
MSYLMCMKKNRYRASPESSRTVTLQVSPVLAQRLKGVQTSVIRLLISTKNFDVPTEKPSYTKYHGDKGKVWLSLRIPISWQNIYAIPYALSVAPDNYNKAMVEIAIYRIRIGSLNSEITSLKNRIDDIESIW